MSESELTHLHQLHCSSQEQACYFLLAAAASAVAFAVQKTGDATLSWQLMVLGVATALWGGSFFCGVKHLQFVQAALHSNYALLQLAKGVHPKQPSHLQEFQIATDVTREWVGRHSSKAGVYSTWQLRLLLIGSIFFLAWHVLMIVERTNVP